LSEVSLMLDQGVMQQFGEFSGGGGRHDDAGVKFAAAALSRKLPEIEEELEGVVPHLKAIGIMAWQCRWFNLVSFISHRVRGGKACWFWSIPGKLRTPAIAIPGFNIS
jgi:hypothetical protein